MLQCQNRCRHQHRNLLAIGGSLECCTNSNLGLSKSYITAYQPIHRAFRLHISLDSLGSLGLVRCILPLERCLQRLLQITIRREGKTLTRLTLGIESDKFSRDILDSTLGGIFEFLPSTTAQLMHLWRLIITALIARDAVQGVYIHKEHISVTIDQLYCLTHSATIVNLDQTAKATHSVIDMGNIVAHLQGVQLGDGHLLIALNLTVYLVAVVALEESMFGIECYAKVVVCKSVVQSQTLQLKRSVFATRGIE